jgi:hypothetical protein
MYTLQKKIVLQKIILSISAEIQWENNYKEENHFFKELISILQ